MSGTHDNDYTASFVGDYDYEPKASTTPKERVDTAYYDEFGDEVQHKGALNRMIKAEVTKVLTDPDDYQVKINRVLATAKRERDHIDAEDARFNRDIEGSKLLNAKSYKIIDTADAVVELLWLMRGDLEDDIKQAELDSYVEPTAEEEHEFWENYGINQMEPQQRARHFADIKEKEIEVAKARVDEENDLLDMFEGWDEHLATEEVTLAAIEKVALYKKVYRDVLENKYGATNIIPDEFKEYAESVINPKRQHFLLDQFDFWGPVEYDPHYLDSLREEGVSELEIKEIIDKNIAEQVEEQRKHKIHILARIAKEEEQKIADAEAKKIADAKAIRNREIAEERAEERAEEQAVKEKKKLAFRVARKAKISALRAALGC